MAHGRWTELSKQISLAAVLGFKLALAYTASMSALRPCCQVSILKIPVYPHKHTKPSKVRESARCMDAVQHVPSGLSPPSAPSPSARMRLPISLSRTRLSDTVASITSWMGLLVEGVNTGYPHAREFHLQHFSEDVLLSNVAAIFWRVQLTSICLPVKAGCV